MMTRDKIMTKTGGNITEESKMVDHHEKKKTCLKQRSLHKLKLLAGGSIAAAVIAMTSVPASVKAQTFNPVAGQAFQATATSPTGGVIFDGPRTTNLDSLLISTSEVLINWQALDTNAAVLGPDGLPSNPINILPSGRTLRFSSASSDYTVLNRILPTASAAGRPVEFNGIVESFANGNPGGNVWFYSPGGIIAGATGRFDVGNLVLTANDIDITGGLFGPSGEIRFRGAGGSRSAVSIASGAQINALQESSYVALVAPRVVQGGTVTVNGSTAYVAAEQADITINQGIFDIAVTVGTENANGIVHTGTTTGPTRLQTSGPFNPDNQKIYMVAVPKNQALTMLLSGSVGYTPATGAVIDERDGSIILSAGGSVAGTSFSNTIDKTVDPARNASISFSDVNFSNSIEAFANNDIVIQDILGAPITGAQDLNAIDFDFTSGGAILMEAGGGGGIIDIDGDVTLNAVNGVQLIARQNSSINIGGSLTINAFSETQGGTVDILASGSGSRTAGSGEIVITDEFVVNAGIAGRDSRFSTVDDGTDTFGGTINLDIVAGGLLDINSGGNFGTSLLSASAAPNMGLVTAGESVGGTININIDGIGSTLTDSGALGLAFEATGNAGSNFNGTAAGGTNTGGTINFNVADGIINAGSIDVDASASGTSNANGNLTVTNNGANAGDITTNFTNATLNITGTLQYLNFAEAKSGFDGAGNQTIGTAVAGDLNVTFDNTDFNGGSLALATDYTGSGTAGDLFLNVINGSDLSLTGDLQLQAEGNSRTAGAPSNSGNVNLLVDNASLDSQSFDLSSFRSTFAAADAVNDGNTGSVNVTVRNGGSLTGRQFSVDAGARTQTQGGAATAGDITINVDGGTIALVDGPSLATSVRLSASASGRSNADDGFANERGLGVGGNITLTLNNGGSFSAETFNTGTNGSIEDIEEGPIPIRGTGGNGVGGVTTFNLISGNFAANDMSISSSGFASFGGDSAPFGFPEQPGIVGNGGDGQGGDVVFNLNGANVNVNNLTVSADGVGGDGGSGRDLEGVAAGNAGAGTGGNATFNANSGSLTVANMLTIAAGGFGGRGGDGIGVNAGVGGDSVGGTATFNLNGTSTISAQQAIISASTDGGRGGDALFGIPASPTTPPQRAGDGGNALAGTAIFNNISGDITFTSMEVTAIGTGGDAGNDPDAPVRFGVYGSPIPAVGFIGQTAANGGSGTGGNATINLGQDDASNPAYLVDARGIGAKGGEGNSGGNAGAGIGGTAVLNITDSVVSLDSPVVTATGTGGAGGIARTPLGNGGNGGDAQGGIARLEIVGAGAALANTGTPLVTVSDAFGGNGGVGFDDFSGNGGNGGNGGSAIGGTLEIAVRTGADFSLSSAGSFTLSSTGIGGQGGTGGYSYANSSGDGGDGGHGTGGTARLLAQGGTITGNDVIITTTGQGGDAGLRGPLGLPSGSAIYGTDGLGGTGAGGTAILEVQEGSPGIITLGDVQIAANGFNAGDISVPTGIGGRIEITDTSTDSAGLISFGSLNAEALAGAGPMSGFFMSGNSGAISATGDVVINVAGNAEFAYDGDGQLVVGGLMDVNSGASILVTHSNNTLPTISIDVAGTFDARAQGDFNSAGGSIINSDSTIAIRAEGNGSAADLRALTNIDLSAGQNALLDNGSVTGSPITFVSGSGTFVSSGIAVSAGGDGNPSFELFDPNFNATLTGDISSSGAIRINAGGNVIFQTGANVVSDNVLSVSTGDDIIIQSGASVTAANNPVETADPANPFDSINNLSLLAGDLGAAGLLLSTPLTPIASIVAAGDINANGFAVIMTADAMDGLGGTISAGSISADINNAPSNAAIAAIGQSDDNGLLSADCLEGNLCLGALSADNIVQIGQGGVPVQATIENGDIVANRILVSTRRDIVMGADGVASRFIASDEIFVSSTEGDVDLREAELTSGTLGIDAAGSLLGSGSLNSGNDIGITVSDSISAAAINTGGELTTVTGRGGALEGFYTVPGSMDVGVLTVGVGDVNYDAGGDLSFGQINVPGTDIILTAPGSIFVGGTSGAENIDIDGGSISLGSIGAASDIILTATSGIDFGTVSAGGILDMLAGDISGGAADGSDVFVSAFTNLDIDSVLSGNELVVDAENITLGGADGGTVDIFGATVFIGGVSGGTIIVSGDVIEIDNASGGDLDVIAQQNLTVNSINIAGNATLNAIDQAMIGDGNVDGNLFLTGAGVALDSGNIGGDLTMNAGAGDIDGNGIVDVGGTIDLDATGNIAFGSLSAGTSFDATAGGAITFTAATADSDLTLDAVAEISGGDVSSGAETSVVGSDLALDSLSGDEFARFRASNGNITIGNVESSSAAIFGAASGTIAIESLSAANGIRLEGVDGIDVNSAASSTGVFISTNGDVAIREDASFSDSLTARGNSIFIRSNGSLNTIAQANVGDIDIVTAGNLSVDDANAVGNIRLISLGGSAALNEIIAGNASFSGSSTGITGQATISANGNIDITAATDVLINSTTNAANALTITAGNLIDIQALATGTTINLSSSDINISSSGRLGDFEQTNDIFIQSNGTNQAILGGAGTTGVFSLNNDEFSRIQSNQDLTIFIAGTGSFTPDLIVQDLTIRAGDNVSGPQSATIGFSGALTIDSGQSTRVDGNLNLANASGSTTLNMTSQNDFRINANGGLIQVTDANGGFGGVGLMTLTAQNIYAMTDQAFDDISGLGIDAIDQRLANNDGVNIDGGLIRGGFAEFVVDGDLFIQNTAPSTDFDARRGFTVDSLTINGLSAGSNANIIINGVVDGVTGIDTIPTTDISVGFDSGSTINGCVIVDPTRCGTPTPTPTPPQVDRPRIDDPVQDIIEEEVTADEDGSVVNDPFETNLIELKETEEFVDDPLIDEPVTGAGNDDLWMSDENTGGDENDECENGNDTCGQGGPAEEGELEPAE